MGENDLKEVAKLVADTIKKPEHRIEYTKIWIGILGFTGIILSIGFVGGNLVSWKDGMTDFKNKAEITIEQHSIDIATLKDKNYERRKYNDTVGNGKKHE